VAKIRAHHRFGPHPILLPGNRFSVKIPAAAEPFSRALRKLANLIRIVGVRCPPRLCYQMAVPNLNCDTGPAMASARLY